MTAGTLFGVNQLFYSWLGLNTEQLDEPRAKANYGNTPEAARTICNQGIRESAPPVIEAFWRIKGNLTDAAANGHKAASNKNYRWSKQLNMQAHNSGEKRLEKLVASLLGEDWVNMVPVCSGFTPALEGGRRIDLARRLSDDKCEFIELKYAGLKSRATGGADHPLYAAIEVLQYGLVYLAARQMKLISDAQYQQYLKSISNLDLVVLAPAEFYEGFEMEWVCKEVNSGLAELAATEDLPIQVSLRCDVLSKEFVSFYHGMEELLDDKKILYAEGELQCNSDDVTLSEYEETFRRLFPAYTTLFGGRADE